MDLLTYLRCRLKIDMLRLNITKVTKTVLKPIHFLNNMLLTMSVKITSEYLAIVENIHSHQY